MKITKIIERNRNSIVLVDLQKQLENNQVQINIRGTGFIISPDGTFVTNAHVYKSIPENELAHIGASVPGENKDNVLRYDRFPVKLLKLDEENDIAIMQIISDKKFEAVSGFDESDKVEEGDETVFIGYPLANEMLSMGFGITMTSNQCLISSIKRRGSDGSLHFYLIDTHTNNGSSGSPIFSLKTGKIIGVVSGKISSRVPIPNGQVMDIPANIGICRPIKYVIDLINKK